MPVAQQQRLNPRAELLNLSEVAKRFGVCERTIRRWLSANEFAPCVCSGRQKFWVASDIVEWFRANRTASGRRTRRVERS